MKQSINSTATMQIMIAFILLFVGFLAVYMNFSRTFKVKNEVISIIERKQGLTTNGSETGAVEIIDNYLLHIGYHNQGHCPIGDGRWYGVNTNTASAQKIEIASNNKEYNYCVKKTDGYDKIMPNKAYYEILMFFDFDLPVFGNMSTFRVEGTTVDISKPLDELQAQ